MNVYYSNLTEFDLLWMFMNYVDHNIHHLASEHDITMSDIFHKVSKGKTKTMLTMDLELDKKTCQPSPAEGFEYQTLGSRNSSGPVEASRMSRRQVLGV